MQLTRRRSVRTSTDGGRPDRKHRRVGGRGASRGREADGQNPLLDEKRASPASRRISVAAPHLDIDESAVRRVRCFRADPMIAATDVLERQASSCPANTKIVKHASYLRPSGARREESTDQATTELRLFGGPESRDDAARRVAAGRIAHRIGQRGPLSIAGTASRSSFHHAHGGRFVDRDQTHFRDGSRRRRPSTPPSQVPGNLGLFDRTIRQWRAFRSRRSFNVTTHVRNSYGGCCEHGDR